MLLATKPATKTPESEIVDWERVSGGPTGRRTMAMCLVDAANSRGEGKRSCGGTWRELGFVPDGFYEVAKEKKAGSGAREVSNSGFGTWQMQSLKFLSLSKQVS